MPSLTTSRSIRTSLPSARPGLPCLKNCVLRCTISPISRRLRDRLMATILSAQNDAKAGEDQRYVYRFGGGVSDGGAGDRNLLGGKGANLAEMASIGLPVPPGFTISTEMCTRYYEDGAVFPESLRAEVAAGLTHIEGITAKAFGDPKNPLLVSVRSGARASMPGMMDTVLNLGLNDKTVEALAEMSGD